MVKRNRTYRRRVEKGWTRQKRIYRGWQRGRPFCGSLIDLALENRQPPLAELAPRHGRIELTLLRLSSVFLPTVCPPCALHLSISRAIRSRDFYSKEKQPITLIL